MSNKIVNEIRKLPIDSTPKMLLWVIADIADEDGSTGWYAPRSRLIEETGYSHSTIAVCISYLKECGILQVIGANGKQNQYIVTPENFNSSVKYEPKKQSKPVSEVDQSTKQTSQLGGLNQSATLTTPVDLAEKPVSEVDTIPHSIIYPSVYPSLGDSENPPDEKPKPSNPKSEKPNKQKRVTKKQIGINKLVELGCDEKYASDWMTARKGAELTDSILENLSEQARKANISIAIAVEWAAKKGYQGFKADWYLKDQQPQQNWNNGYQTSQQRTASEHDRWRQAENEVFGNSELDVTPKKSFLIEEVGHA